MNKENTKHENPHRIVTATVVSAVLAMTVVGPAVPSARPVIVHHSNKDVIPHRVLLGRLLRTAVTNLHKGSILDISDVKPGNNYVLVARSIFSTVDKVDIELISIRTNIIGFTTIRYIDLDTNEECVLRAFKNSLTFFSYKEDIQF